MYSCDVKSEFSASLFQSSVAHDPSQILLIWWFGVQERLLFIISAENLMLSSMLCLFILQILWQMESSKESFI